MAQYSRDNKFGSIDIVTNKIAIGFAIRIDINTAKKIRRTYRKEFSCVRSKSSFIDVHRVIVNEVKPNLRELGHAEMANCR